VFGFHEFLGIAVQKKHYTWLAKTIFQSAVSQGIVFSRMVRRSIALHRHGASAVSETPLVCGQPPKKGENGRFG